MNRNVLLVDDDQMLLSSMKRCLGAQFNLDTSLCAQDALYKIDSSETYAVIITDMRMPNIDGIEFIRRARILSPESIYMMLTGNQDTQTAVRAVNEGQVKRFLNKPCDPGEIARFIEEGLLQFESGAKERQLLHETLLGILRAYSTTFAKLAPEVHAKVDRTQSIFNNLCAHLKVTPRAEYEVAIPFLHLGFTGHTGDSWKEVCRAAATEVQAIPQMATVAHILRDAADNSNVQIELQPKNMKDAITTGACLLRVSCEVERLGQGDVAMPSVRNELARALDDLPDELVEIANDLLAETQTAPPESANC